MDFAPSTSPALPRPAVIAIALSLGAVGVVAAVRPELGIIGIVGLVAAVLIVKRIEWALPFGMFLVYINFPAIASAQGLPSSLAGMAAFGVLAIPVAYRLLVKREPLQVNPALLPLVLFSLTQFLGCMLAPNPEKSVKIVMTTITEGLILFVIVTNAIQDRRAVKLSLWAVVLAGGIMGAVPMHQYATGNVFKTYGGLASMDETDLEHARERGIDLTDKRQYGGRIRLAGVIGEKNRFAQILVMVLPFCAALALIEKGWLRYLAVALAVGAVGGIVVSFSRGAIAGFGAALFAAAFMKVIRWRELVIAMVLASAVVLCHPGFRSRIVALGAYAGLPVERSPDAGEETSVQGRMNEMTTALKVFCWNPVLGVGPGGFGKYYAEMAGFEGGKQHAGERRSHNLFLNIAADHGLCGLLTFGAYIVGILGRLKKSRLAAMAKDREMVVLCGAMIVLIFSYLATGMFLHFAYVRYFWLMSGVAAAVASVAQSEIQHDTELAT